MVSQEAHIMFLIRCFPTIIQLQEIVTQEKVYFKKTLLNRHHIPYLLIPTNNIAVSNFNQES